jgi:hypothetical protein
VVVIIVHLYRSRPLIIVVADTSQNIEEGQHLGCPSVSIWLYFTNKASGLFPPTVKFIFTIQTSQSVPGKMSISHNNNKCQQSNYS